MNNVTPLRHFQGDHNQLYVVQPYAEIPIPHDTKLDRIEILDLMMHTCWANPGVAFIARDNLGAPIRKAATHFYDD